LYPFKVLVRPHPEADAKTHQVLISVPRRNIRVAARRNRVKRLIRECYRQNKNLLPDSPKLTIAYIYTPKEILTFAQLQERFLKTIKRIGHVEKK
jgi:ribonuclease P protein component